MFENVVLRKNLNCKIVPGQLSVGRFGQGQTETLVAVSQSLDKLVIHDPALRSEEETCPVESRNITLTDYTGDSEPQLESELVYYIGLKDVIKTISTKKVQVVRSYTSSKQVATSGNDQMINNSTKDLLLIGCSSSLMVFDVFNQNKLININTLGPVEAIACDPHNVCLDTHPINCETRPLEEIICGGQQKIYSMRLETQFDKRTIDAELSCERSTGATINCLARGSVCGIPVLLAGSLENKLLIYQLDTFDHNIQPCRLSIDETAPINCICPITTKEDREGTPIANNDLIGLPSLSDHLPLETTTNEHMNYFAYGCGNSFIGVYRLLGKLTGQDEGILSKERIWRHKCKSNPVSMLMYDINGDGFDELIVGYNNSRLEARSPFTGQLLTATRCFKSGRLAGIAVIDYYRDGGLILIACSTNGSMIGYKPRLSKPGVPLQGFSNSIQNLQLNDLSSLPIAHNSSIDLNRESNNPQDCSVFTENPNDLHIELSSDHATPIRSDAKQSQDLLQNINSLLNEDMSLEAKACHIYHLNLNQASMSHLAETRIAHSWSYDSTKAALRLTIVIGTNMEKVVLIKLEDECRVFLNSGYLLINPVTSSYEGGNSLVVVVVPLRSNENKPTILKLSVFCSLLAKASDQRNDGMGVDRICSVKLDVPRYAMFTLANQTNNTAAGILETPSVKKSIIVSFPLKDSSKIRQAVNWVYQNFLCLQFGKLIGEESLPYQSGQSDTKLMSTEGKFRSFNTGPAETQGFELKFLDMRKIIEPDSEYGKLGGVKVSEESECKFGRFDSELRIAHSNSRLVIESNNHDLVVDLVRILVIDRLQLEPTPDSPSPGLKQEGFPFDISPLLSELKSLSEDSGQLEESERRIQTELYESAEHTKNLMQQFAIATELNEFNTAKELLNELFMMLNNVQNAAKTHCINNKSRLKLCKRADELREMAALLTKLYA